MVQTVGVRIQRGLDYKKKNSSTLSGQGLPKHCVPENNNTVLLTTTTARLDLHLRRCIFSVTSRIRYIINTRFIRA